MNYTERARQLRPYIEKAAVSLADEDALQAVELFPQWVTGHAYVVDERLQYKNVLYRVVQAHTSQADWTPDKTPALFVVVSLDEWPNSCSLLVRTMRTKRATRSRLRASTISA